MSDLRSRLPDRRFNANFDIDHNGIRYTVGVGHWPDGRVGEVFLGAGKAGDAICNHAHDNAVLLSLMLQHGVPVDQVRRAVRRHPDGKPAGALGAILDRLFADPLLPVYRPRMTPADVALMSTQHCALEHDGVRYTVAVFRVDGNVREIFLDAGGVGSDIQLHAHDNAALLSLMLQHDVPIDVMRHAVARRRDGSAAGPIGAVLDLLFGSLGFVPADQLVPLSAILLRGEVE